MKKVNLIILIIILSISVSCKKDDNKKNLIIFHAGSLSALMKNIKIEFEKKYNVEIVLESSGSVDAARKITDLKRKCDIIALSDSTLFEELLKPYCPFVIDFASNEIVLAYMRHGRYAKDIESDFMNTLKRKDILISRSDPLRDPCGYRTFLVWKLMSKYYKDESIEQICLKRSPLKLVRPKEIDCIYLLESKSCDAIWIYKSVAINHNYKYLKFDDHINLSNPLYENYYKKACIKLKDRKYTLEKCGSTIKYGISMLKNSKNIDESYMFINFLFSENGQKIILNNGFKSIKPKLKVFDKTFDIKKLNL